MLINTLLQRIFDARGKHKLEALLKKVKASGDKKRLAFKSTGDEKDLLNSVNAAIGEAALKEADIRLLVDELEENGGQHIFIFKTSAEGSKALTTKAFAAKFPKAPAVPKESFYEKYPDEKQISYELRDGRYVTVKQVFTTTFWKRNNEKSKETATQRLWVYDRVRRRSVNLFRLDTKTGNVEVRIDHVHDKDDKLALQMLEDFKKDLLTLVDFEEHLLPVAVTRAYPKIIAAREETFMSIDEAFDASASLRLANRREEMKGKDVRDHPSHSKTLLEKTLARSAVRVYWLIGKDDDQRKVHAIISTIEVPSKDGEGLDYSKVYIAAKVDAKDLDHAIARIRHFAD